MSQTKFLAVAADTVVRGTDYLGWQGDGGSHRLYAGYHDAGDGIKHYYSYLKFTLDWANVGKIISATLVLYNDDHYGLFPQAGAADRYPKVTIQRLTSAFTVGDNADGVWDADDTTNPGVTLSGKLEPGLAKGSNALERIDITSLFNQWAPASVKQSTGAAGPGAANYGLQIGPYDSDVGYRWSGWSSKHTDAGMRPTIELVYDYGPTAPNVPTNLTPITAVTSLVNFQGDFSDIKTSDTLAYTEIEVYDSSGTTKLWSSGKQRASNSDIVAARFHVLPSNFTPTAGTTYKWKARVTDQENQVSAWTALQSFSVSNTAPSAPTLTPATGSSFASLHGVLFRGGTFSDADGDKLLAYQIELSAYPSGNANWDDPAFILWETGKRYVAGGSTSWETSYGGQPLAAGTYYWRARQWDNREGLSAWTYASIVLTADFTPEPGSQGNVQFPIHIPWRIIIRGMAADRGPGSIVAILEDAKSVGASLMYNSPGELHFTLPVDHPQVSVIEPRQTHYALELYSGDGWREVFAGLVVDYDATDTAVIFYGLDYLALFDAIYDDRFDPAYPDKSYDQGGSKYVDKTLNFVVTDQLQRAVGISNSPVGFISVGSIATMDEHVTIFSTMQPTGQFVVGLIDSHRQGTGKMTRLQVVKVSGVYTVQVVDNPGTTKDNLTLRYGELVQGYEVIPFGTGWASTQHVIGRARDGTRIMFKTQDAPGIDQAIWGHFAQVQVIDGVADENDLVRRAKQAAMHAGKVGQKVALGIRSGTLQPRDGYDIADQLPVHIIHGVVDTTAFGSGYWSVYGISWEAGDAGQTTTTLTLLPREDTTAPDPDLIPVRPILSRIAQWEVGWSPPDPLMSTSDYWVDRNTGLVYVRGTDGTYTVLPSSDPAYGTAAELFGSVSGAHNLILNSSFELSDFTPAPTEKIWTLTADWTGSIVGSAVNLTTANSLTVTGVTY